MASTYSTSLKLELIGTGDQSGSWGNTTNNNLGTLLEQAIVGQSTIVMANADYTLSNIDGTTDEARNAAIIITGSQSGTYNVICPAVQKLYMITNNLSSSATAYFKPASGTAISIANGNTILAYCTGTTMVPLNYVDKAGAVANITGGSASLIPYQTATNTTGFITAPTSGTFLRWNGTAYDWSSSTGSASTITGGTANQILYQVGAGSTSFITAPSSSNTVLNWTGTAFNWVSNAGGTTTQTLTFNNSGTAGGSSQTFNGSLPITISYNTIGASPLAGSSSLTTTGTVTTGTWSGSFGAVSGANLTNLTGANVTGTVASATSASSVPYSGLTGTVPTWNQNTTGNAATATTATTAATCTGNAATVTNGAYVNVINAFTATSNSFYNRVSIGGGVAGINFNLDVLGQANQTVAILTTAGSSGNGLVINCTGGTTSAAIFQNAGSATGQIVCASGGTTYTSISDRRLKDNIVPLTNSGSVIDSLQPREFVWNNTGESAKGFIADELQQIIPGAVHGEPNAVDEEGKPVYQGIDASTPEMVALMIAELQALRIRVAQLEAK